MKQYYIIRWSLEKYGLLIKTKVDNLDQVRGALSAISESEGVLLSIKLSCHE